MSARIRFFARLSVLAGVLGALWVPSVAAQELRGQIVGVATDSTGAALPGVIVTATAPGLVQPQVTTTTADGSYRFPSLPPGDYVVQFELSGFQTVRREGITLTLRTVLKVDASLAPASVSTEVNVVAKSPVVDVTSTAVGTSFNKELLTDIPTARDLWSAMALAPGFSMAGVDVGGSHVGSQTQFTAYGVGTGTRTLIEGIISNNSRTSNSGYFDYGSFQEFELGASGNMGEAAGPGGLLNFTVKSGTDAFHGNALINYQNDAMRSDNVPDALLGTGSRDEDGFFPPPAGIGESNAIAKMYDFNTGIGGPIVRQKALFYASYRDNNYYNTVAGLPGVETQSRLMNATAKVNYALNQSNTLTGFYSWRYKLDAGRGISAAVPPESTQYQDGRMHLAKLEWSSVLNARTYLDMQIATARATNLRTSPLTKSRSTEGLTPGRQDLVTGQFSGANPELRDNLETRPQFTGSLSYSADGGGWGSHFLKLGFQVHKFTTELLNFNVDDVFYFDRSGRPAEITIYNTPVTATNTNRNIGIYLQDAWNVASNVTLNLGMRYDNYALGWPASNHTANQSALFPPVSTEDTTLVTWNAIAPRIGVAWDVTGDSRTALKAFAGRYYLDPVDAVTEQANPVGWGGRRYVFSDLDGDMLLDPGELGNLLSTTGGAGALRVDPNIKQPYGDEYSVHLQREILEGQSVRVSYVYKNLRRLDAEVDLGFINAFTVPFNFVDIGADNIAGTADDQVLNLVDRAAGAVSDRVWTNPGPEVGTPKNEADYQTLELAYNRPLRDNWLFMTSFGHTWAKEFSNVTSRTGVQDFVSHTQVFTWNPNQRRFGQNEPTYWNFKAVGRYEWNFGLGAASTYRLLSGYNWARTISVRFPTAGSTNVPADPLSENRAPAVSILDFRLDQSVKAGNSTLMFYADFSNMLNAGTVTNFRTGSGTRFKEVIALLPPRAVRIAAEWRF
jgi:hypothetical protein